MVYVISCGKSSHSESHMGLHTISAVCQGKKMSRISVYLQWDFQREQDFHHENCGNYGEISDIQERVQNWMIQVDLRFTTSSNSRVSLWLARNPLNRNSLSEYPYSISLKDFQFQPLLK